MAYDLIREMDCLDVSNEGNIAWEASLKRYEEQIKMVEGEIITKLRELFGAASNSNEMFRIFRRFNLLFVRPNIKGSIREYQAPLIEKTKVDIQALQVGVSSS